MACARSNKSGNRRATTGESRSPNSKAAPAMVSNSALGTLPYNSIVAASNNLGSRMMREAQRPRLWFDCRLLDVSRRRARRRIEKQHKFAGRNVLGHLRRELVRADHPHLGIIAVMVLQHLRHVTADVVIAAQRASVPDYQHFGQLTPPKLVKQLAAAAPHSTCNPDCRRARNNSGKVRTPYHRFHAVQRPYPCLFPAERM